MTLLKWLSAKYSEAYYWANTHRKSRAVSQCGESCGLSGGGFHHFKYWHGIHKLVLCSEQQSAEHMAAGKYHTIFEQLAEDDVCHLLKYNIPMKLVSSGIVCQALGGGSLWLQKMALRFLYV